MNTEVFEIIDEVSAKWDLLLHPFYVRWKAGELTQAELAYYAGQYAHIVRAIPRWLDTAARQHPEHAADLRSHAAEEAEHILLWDRFGVALGMTRSEIAESPANLATTALVGRCDELASGGQAAAVVWALEAQSPEVSAEKLRGLEQHYNLGADDGGAYFALHQTRDVAHAAELRSVIKDGPEAGAAAADVLAGMWELLSSVEKPV